MTFDQHRSYFHAGLPGQDRQAAATPAPDGAPTATEIVARYIGLAAAIATMQSADAHHVLTALCADNQVYADAATFGALWAGEPADKPAQDQAFAERMAAGGNLHVELEAGTQRIEMQAGGLRLLADSIGLADEVTVELSDRIARAYWHKVATTSDRPWK